MLLFQTFPIYIKATIDALIGRKRKFEVTEKGQSHKLALTFLWPQISMLFLCFIAVVWGVNRMIFEAGGKWAIGANIFWCLYNFIILSFVFYFNNPKINEKIGEYEQA
jgi:hypothetical protein